MKKNSYIGYSIAILSGILLVCSALLSLTMTLGGGVLSQGESLLTVFLAGNVNDHMLSLSIVFYIISIVFGLINIICAIVGMILVANDKYSKIYLIIQRIISLLAFISIIVSFIILGLYLSKIEATVQNFMGFGILVAILATLLLIEGEFLVRAQAVVNKKEEN